MPESKTQALLKALSSPVRREILWMVWNRELPVAAIAARFDLRPPTISQHLAVLREAGAVTMRPEGTSRYYRADQDALRGLRSLLPESPQKWTSTTDHPEQRLAVGTVASAVVVTATAPCTPTDAFAAFTDGALYTRWLGVPVSLAADQFCAEMEWGVVVRGTYEATHPPHLIVMDWDFAQSDVPTPGGGDRAYLFFRAAEEGGTRLELQQFARTPEQAEFMDRAWRFVLGRFVDRIEMALDPLAEPPAFPTRPRASIDGRR